MSYRSGFGVVAKQTEVAPTPLPEERRRGPVPSRAEFARALDSIGLLDRLLWLKARLNLPALTVLTYHRITVTGDGDGLDDEVVEANPDEFLEQMDVVKRHCTVISLADVFRFRSGKPLPRNPVLVAFDDGYADNFHTALPTLRKATIPATFFVPTAFPETKTMFWWDRVALLLRRCGLDQVELSYPTPMTLMPRGDVKKAIRQVCRAIKSTFGVDLRRLWDELERATGVTLSEDEEARIARRSILDWSQIRALRAAGMDVQSHSHRHLVLGTLTPDQAREDLKVSRAILSDVLGEDVRAVAYPVGHMLRGPWRQVVDEAGMSLGFTNNTGLCRLNHFDALNIERLAMDRSNVGALYKLILLLGARPNPLAIA